MLMNFMKSKGLVPQISETEKIALEAGTVWIDGELFSGTANFDKMLKEPYPSLTAEEQAFLDGPVEEVCKMVSEWETITTRSLPDKVWAHLKEHRYFCLLIPEEEGGRGFSPLLVSSVIAKLAPVSSYLCVCVLIPNSVGPAELIHMYGTKEQKEHYLPKLAKGEYIPCFGLTEPNAGSDAASIQSRGEVFKGEDGELYIKLNFSKRYITLAPIANLVGLAFDMHDPGNLLGKGEHPGITCALIHGETEGVELGAHHDPNGVPFPNGPVFGKDVVVPVKQIIGGTEFAGNGWKMLMEALSGGRAVSLPAQSVGGILKLARVVGAYASIRSQFNTPIANFEGIQEPLAKICGFTYMMDASRKFTCGSLMSGHRPSVVSALIKLRSTEMVREATLDGIDILGGKGICRGPSNPLGIGYQGATIGITVEGANILTRTLIIFGQGAIRCHPYALEEIQSLMKEDSAGFLKATLKHLGFFAKNCVLGLLLSLTRGYIARSPVNGKTARYYQKLKWMSVIFAAFSDLALFTIGSSLKKRGKLTGRYADILSWMFIGFSTLRRYEAEGRKAGDLPIVEWCMEYCFAKIQEGFKGIFANFDVPVLGFFVRNICGFWSRVNSVSSGPSDKVGAQLAKIICTPGLQRDRLTEGVHLGRDINDPVKNIDTAFDLAVKAGASLSRIKKARRKHKWPKSLVGQELYEKAIQESIITKEESEVLTEADKAVSAAIQVDHFDKAAYNSYFQKH